MSHWNLKKEFKPETTTRIDELAHEIANIDDAIFRAYANNAFDTLPIAAINDLQRKSSVKKAELMNHFTELFASLNMVKEWAALTMAIKIMQEWKPE